MWPDRTPRDGNAVGSLSSAWGAYVPEYVIDLLRRHADAPPTDAGEAVVLFADVAGFTPMSEALARIGQYGTEELTGLLNSWFDAMTDRITQYGGSVTEFVGDALTAVFPYGGETRMPTARRAVQCALDMQTDMVRFRPVSTSAGAFRLTMKVGVASGPLLPTVMGDRSVRLGHLLLGPALERAITTERHAGGDEVVVDDGLLVQRSRDELARRDDHWWLVRRLRPRPAPLRRARQALLDDSSASLLAPFLHPAIAERLRSGRRELVNEHRNVTAVFVGLPKVPVDDRAAVGALRRYLAAAVRLIAHYGGHFRHVALDGDGVVLVAFFGAPVGHEDDAERAVHCGLELLQLSGGPFRAGLTTGAVYCGEVGGDLRREYAVIGDSVNLASRLMHIAGDNELIVDAATLERVRDSTLHQRLRPVPVKGKTGAIDIWAVRSLREGLAEPDQPATGLPLIGRDAELARARAVVERVRAGAGHILFLTGDAGIGKSRLAAEILRSAQAVGFATFGGASRSHSTTTSYLVWRSICRDLLELNTELPIADRQAQLVAALTPHRVDAAQRAPLLAPVLNLPIPDSELIAPLDPQTRDGLLRALVVECVRHRASSTPIVLVLEDCHWIDGPSAALLEFLARRIDDLPVLILVTARGTLADDTTPASLAQLAHGDELRLEELARDEAEQLVEQRLRGDRALDAAVVRRIAERGGGNPFYLGELVNYVLARGLGDGGTRAQDPLELPDGLQRLLTARLDQLSEGQKATIKVASVIGRRFLAGWISEIYPAAGGPEEVAGHLRRLHELDLTPRRDGGTAEEYQFKHAMTQEAAYLSLTFQVRESLHERAGLLIEATSGDRLAQFVDVLAHHYGRTQRFDKQRVWFKAAGVAAKAAFANEAAVAYFERLLPLLPEAETGEVLVELGGVWNLTGKWAEAELAYRTAMQVADKADRPEIVAASQRDLGDLFMYNLSYTEAVTWLRRAADQFDRLGDRAGLSRTLDRLTFALHQQGAYDDALAAAERHRALATEMGDLAALSIALNHTGLVHLQTGRSDEARALLEQALETATKAGDRRYLLHAATNLALVHLRLGEHREAIVQGRRAFEVAQEIEFRQTAGVVVGNMGEVYRDHGDNVRALRCVTYALRIAIELQDWTSVADQVANAAALAAAEGRYGEAERHFEQAIALARHLDAPYLLCGWLHRLAKVQVHQDRWETAEGLNQESLDIADAHGEREIQIRAAVLSQWLVVSLGRRSAKAAIATLREWESGFTAPYERALLLEARWRLDPTDEAARLASAALFRELYTRTPTVEYQTAYTALTGVTLPPPSPLPDLPEAIGEEDANIEELLAQVERLGPHLEGSSPLEVSEVTQGGQ